MLLVRSLANLRHLDGAMSSKKSALGSDIPSNRAPSATKASPTPNIEEDFTLDTKEAWPGSLKDIGKIADNELDLDFLEWIADESVADDDRMLVA